MANRRDTEDRFGRVKTAGKAALAFGAGAAFLYKGSTNTALINEVGKYKKALSSSVDSLSSRSLKDIHGRGAKVLSDEYKNIKQAVKQMDNTVSLNTQKNNLVGALHKAHSIKSDKEKFLRDIFIKDEFIPKTKELVQKSFSKEDAKRVNNIVDDILQNSARIVESVESNTAEKTLRLSQEFRKAQAEKFSEVELDTVEEIITKKLLNKEKDFADYFQRMGDLPDQIVEKILDPESLAETFGRREDKFFDDLLGTTSATFREVVENFERIEIDRDGLRTIEGKIKDHKLPGAINKSNETMYTFMKELLEKDDRYGDLIVDDALKINRKGDFIDLSLLEKKKDELAEAALHTIPGKLVKNLETHVYKKKAPQNFHIAHKGSVDFLLPKILEGRESTVLENTYIKINSRGFKVTSHGLERVEAMDKMFLTSGEYGHQARLYKSISGEVDYKKERGFIETVLDLGSSPKLSMKDKAFLSVKKFSDPKWMRNLVDDKRSIESRLQSTNEYLSDIEDINKMFKTKTEKLNRATINKLLKANISDDSREMFELLNLDDDDLYEAISTLSVSDRFINSDASSLIKRFKKDPDVARSMISVTDNTVDFGFKKQSSRAENFSDLIRKEIAKEGILRQIHSESGNSMLSVIDDISLTSKELSNLKRLTSWAVLQDSSGASSHNMSIKSTAFAEEARAAAELLLNSKYYQGNDAGLNKMFNETLDSTVKDFTSLRESFGELEGHMDSIEKANRANKFVYVQNAVTPLDLLRDINDTEKIKSFGKQFYAGRKNMEDFTEASFYPYFSVMRLFDSLPSFLSLSPENTGDVYSLSKNLIMKRVLPVVAAGYTLSYLNYESENVFGRSLTEAGAVSLSNFDLGIRTFIDKTPLSEPLKDMWYSNDFISYHIDSPYRDVEEQVEWYKTGVSPVRKGRWWNMSVSEFRGGKIEYFEPNKLRQTSVAWRDIGVYGSSEEKWKHSIVPTIRHPFSTLRYLADPYWLEKKNKYSRPYPISAPLFSEGAPWSSALNATIGQGIKPRREMYKGLLDKNFIDPRDLIERENKKIKVKSQGKDSYILMTDSNSASNEILIGGEDHVWGGRGFAQGSYSGESGGISTSHSDFKLNIKDKVTIPFLRKTQKQDILKELEEINLLTKYKGQAPTLSDTNLAKRYDQLVAADTLDLLRDKDIAAELRSTTSTKEFIRDAGYSTRQLGGIYGFAFDEMFPREKKHVLENASNMDSFSKRFWDESIGGLGDSFMEIARRFFPHSNRDNIQINPIRNNMPDWMPERFKHGDPYTQVKKGEIRLPGKAYEAINHYKPELDLSVHEGMLGASVRELEHYFMNKDAMDEEYFNSGQAFSETIDLSERQLQKANKNIQKARENILRDIEAGKINSGQFYDEFERFKILADVAPYSEEYKQTKANIRESLNEYNKEEYYKILDRVEKQSRAHNFYNYRYTKTKYETEKGYIDQITNDGFTIVGSNKIYSLAGLAISEEGMSQMMAPGDEVNLKYEHFDGKNEKVKVVAYRHGENLNRLAAHSEFGDRVDDGAKVSAYAFSSGTQQVFGAIGEVIGHAPIPVLHNRFLRLETPLEAYENEQVYGSPFPTWSNPIRSYLKPSFNKSMNVSGTHAFIGGASMVANAYFQFGSGIDKTDFIVKATELASAMLKETVSKEEVVSSFAKAAKISKLVTTPLATTGAFTGALLNTKYIETASNIGAMIWGTSYLINKSRNPIVGTAVGAGVGTAAANFLAAGTGKKGAKIGAAVGLTMSVLQNPTLKPSEFGGKWIPKDTKKRWEIEEYFDRLAYIKYKGLYEKASRKALSKEGVNIRAIIKRLEKDEEKRDKKREELIDYKQRLLNDKTIDQDYANDLLTRIQYELDDNIGLQEKVLAGKYTKSAIAYKQAMDSTIYGLKKNASWSQILRALPANDRDFFMEFAKEEDPRERKKILKAIAPYKQNVLRNAWGMKEKRTKSNWSYFKKHKLPNFTWSGWRPQVDLDHVQMKTIENEGMLLSDFGFYESKKQEPGYRQTNSLNYKRGTNIASLSTNLVTTMNGLGLTGVEVSIEPTDRPGVQMAVNLTKINTFKVKNRINETLGRAYYPV